MPSQSLRHLSMALALAAGASSVSAIDILPGSASAPPSDLNAFQASFGSFRADRVSQGTKTGPSYAADTLLLRYTRTFTLAGMPAAAYIQPSFTRFSPGGTSWPIPPNSDTSAQSGLGDTGMAFAIWPYANQETGTHLGFAGYAVLPTGDYDSHRLANPGQNRTLTAVQVAYQRRLGKQVDAFIAADAQWHGANDDVALLHVRYEQKPLYTLQAAFMYHVSQHTMLALNLFDHQGAEERFAGMNMNNAVHRTRYQLTASQITPIGRFYLQYGQDLHTNNQWRESQQLWLRYAIPWK